MLQYDISTMTLNDLKKLIASGDDTHDNQLRVTKNGKVFLSQVVAAESLTGIAFRFETFDAGNNYVGKDAADDDNFIQYLYNALISNWNNPSRKTYIDDWLFDIY